MDDETLNEVAEIDEPIAAAEARVFGLTEVLSSVANGKDASTEKIVISSYPTTLHLLRVIQGQLLTDGRTPT